MRIDIITLFPEMFVPVLNESIIGRAQKNGAIEIVCHQLRDFAFDKHRRVDDTPYGGGMGMLMKAEPIALCFEDICAKLKTRPHFVYMSPQGKTLNQKRLKELAEIDNICILCGHYEGVDQRLLDEFIDEEVSIGDYVLRAAKYRQWLLRTPFAEWFPEYLQTTNVLRRKAILTDCLNILSTPSLRFGEVWKCPRF